jgi:hypothetical protein
MLWFSCFAALMGTKNESDVKPRAKAIPPFQVFHLLPRANTQSFQTREWSWDIMTRFRLSFFQRRFQCAGISSLDLKSDHKRQPRIPEALQGNSLRSNSGMFETTTEWFSFHKLLWGVTYFLGAIYDDLLS